VRRRLVQIGAVLILAVCVTGHVSEIFDHWDHTLQTGNDIDYSTVIVALIAGAVFGLAHVAAMLIRTVSVTFRLLPLFVVAFLSSLSPSFTGYSPPPPLRI
jgi:hypothetical protein